MSESEREKLKIMADAAQKEVTLIAASGLMGVSYRQSTRIWRRYQDEGDAGGCTTSEWSGSGDRMA
ncbi:MAG: hypothetical protein NTW75_08200 [Planctomycetales bacterium]|jgi:hypothetical protein|nr:hypothetical protein [Planctomycetales bacterium]